MIMALAPVRAHSQDTAGGAILKGYVRDSSGQPVANATVFLQLATEAQTPAVPAEATHTDSDGAYRFASLPAGAYTLRAEKSGYGKASVDRVPLARKEMRKIDLVLALPNPQNASSGTPAPANPSAQAPEFFDEPQFTVAGVTQASNSGGHGSDTVLRTTEALAKATVALSNDKESSTPEPLTAATESSLREAVARNPKDPALHHRLADIEEKLGNPLESAREYQRAAEIDPSELYLFDWGTELLTHRALEPATEVFTKGNRLFPKSVRMLVALGVAEYARGAYDQASQSLANASDLDPGNPTPYLFLGKMQSAETNPSQQSVERLARFEQLQPDNALANYYYAVSLSKQSAYAADNDAERSARVESLLLKAAHLDPKLGIAYLQLGILYSQSSDFARAIAAYQKAIETTPEEVDPQRANPQLTYPQSDETLAESHYRLAQAYRHIGDKVKAQEQLQLHERFAKKTKEDTEHERRHIQEFVILLRDQNSVSPPQN
jgi:tetratricopeptide (TPR) repeat protein